MATFRTRKSGYTQAIIRRRGHPPESRTFRTKSEAESWARQIEAEIDRGSYQSSSQAERTTFADLAKEFETEFAPHHYRGEGWKHKLKALRDRLNSYSLAAITTRVVTKYRDDRLKAPDPRFKNQDEAPRVSGATIKTELDLLSKMLDVAQKEFGITLPAGNPVSGVRKPSDSKGRERRIGGDEWKILLRECAASGNVWLLPAVKLAVATSMRQGELLNLRWEDIDLHNKLALLRKTKNGESRSVPLNSEARGILRELPHNLKGTVFTMPRRTLYAAFSRACKRGNISDLTFHDLRHEALSRLAERGNWGVLELSAVSGHKTLQMLKRYTHLQATKLAEKMG